MNTIQHSLITLLETKDIEQFKEMVPYVLFPDAIRCFTKERKWSHFEMDPVTGEPNVFKFPTNIKNYDKMDMEDFIDCVINNVDFKPAVIGENSSLEAFRMFNRHLPDIMFIGIEEHLRQDISFDAWVRKEYDCSRKYEDRFIVKGQEIDGKEFRKVISEMEMDAVVCLAYICNKELGVTITNDWFKENVFAPLADVYPEVMVKNTCKYMMIPEKIERQIIAGEWEPLLENTKYLTAENYQYYHDSVIQPIKTLEREILNKIEMDNVGETKAEKIEICKEGIDFVE